MEGAKRSIVQSGPLRRAQYLPDRISSEILAQVSDGRLKPGDALPTEIALASSFGVSRNVVREAIARLRSDGVIETKQGRGAVILPPSERETFRVDMRDLSEKERVANLFELRSILELDAAGLAAIRRSDEELEELEQILDTMRGQSRIDEVALEADSAFHRALGLATRNEYLAAIVDYIAVRLKETTLATDAIYGKGDLLEVTIEEHWAILDAVGRRDATGARQAMWAHIDSAARRLGVVLPDRPH